MDAVLRAAWDELVEVGYYTLTLDAVAKRADTSRTVIYRRWPGKKELVLAAIKWKSDSSRTTVPDTGNLRDDVLEMLREFLSTRGSLVSLLTLQSAAFVAETGMTPADVRNLLMEGRRPSIEVIIERAHARGEVDATRLPPSLRTLPIDLVRGDVVLTLGKPPGDARIVAIVDELFMPLVRLYQQQDPGSR